MSDHTWGRLGRRRPYFLTGAILSSLALLIMPNSSTLWMAAGLLWILDASYLGARADQIPILWLAAPLTGLIVQPIIGHMSDHTWGRLGRRRPYFLPGAILSSLALLIMPNSSTLWMAAGLLWILDASINVSMETLRAFVADLLPEEQRT